jgi:hypothetical protein
VLAGLTGVLLLQPDEEGTNRLLKKSIFER